jgi:hypothetical protein
MLEVTDDGTFREVITEIRSPDGARKYTQVS